MLRILGRTATICLALAGPGLAQGLDGNAERGGLLAERWCASCHIVSETQAQGSTEAPTFRSIAAR